MTEPIAAFLGGVFGREGLVLHGGTAGSSSYASKTLTKSAAIPPW